MSDGWRGSGSIIMIGLKFRPSPFSHSADSVTEFQFRYSITSLSLDKVFEKE